MAASLGSLVVSLGLDAAEFVRGLDRSEYQMRQFNDKLSRAASAGKDLLAGIGAGFSVAGVIAGFDAIHAKVVDEQRAINQLNAVLTATGNGAGLTANALEAVGVSVKNSSIFDDDDIRKAETALLRFRDVQGAVFEQAIRLAPDVAAALGVDLPTAAQALGKALTDPAAGMRALRDAGLHLSEQQKDLAARFIEAGDKASAQQIVIDQLAQSVGGAGEADSAGLYGSSKRLTRAWDDMQKTIGRRITGSGLDDHLTRSLEAFSHDVDYAAEHWKAFLAGVTGGPQAQAMQLAVDAALNAKSRRTSSGKITEVGDSSGADQTALMGRINSQVEQQTNAQYVKDQAALKARAASASTFYAGELAKQKSFLTLQQSALEFSYSQGDVATADFYRKQEELADKQLHDIQVNLGKQSVAQIDLLNATGASPEDKTAARQRLDAISTGVQAADLANQEKILALSQQRALAIQKLSDEYATLGAQVKEAAGDSSAVALEAFDQAHRERLKLFQSEQDAAAGAGNTVNVGKAAGAIASISYLRDGIKAQSDLNDASRDYSRILERLGLQQDAADIAQQTGSTSEIQALVAKSALNLAIIPQLQAQADLYRAIASNADLPKNTRDDAALTVLRTQNDIARLSGQTDLLADKFRGVLKDSFTSAFDELVSGSKSAKDAFRDLEKSIVQGISHIAEQSIADALFGKGGTFGSGGSFDFGSLLSKLLGGGAAAEAPSVDLFSLFAGAAGFASGGSPPMGKVSIVGERGPELFVPNAAGKIIPNDVLMGKRAERAIQVNVNVLPGASTKTANQAGVEVSRALQTALRRNG